MNEAEWHVEEVACRMCAVRLRTGEVSIAVRVPEVAREVLSFGNTRRAGCPEGLEGHSGAPGSRSTKRRLLAVFPPGIKILCAPDRCLSSGARLPRSLAALSTGTSARRGTRDESVTFCRPVVALAVAAETVTASGAAQWSESR